MLQADRSRQSTSTSSLSARARASKRCPANRMCGDPQPCVHEARQQRPQHTTLPPGTFLESNSFEGFIANDIVIPRLEPMIGHFESGQGQSESGTSRFEEADVDLRHQVAPRQYAT